MLLRGYQHGDVSPPRDRIVVPVTDAASVRANQGWAIAAAAVVGVAVALRVVALTAKALWFDETFSVFVAGLPVGRLLAILAANEPHPPLHFLLLHAWIAVFGDSEAAVRAPSVIVGAAVVAVTWLFGRRLIGPWPALLAAGLVALSPSQVAVGQEARMGALLVLTALASWWALWAATAASGARRRAWIAYAVVAAAMLYTHYYGFFVLAAQVVYLVWRRTSPGDWRRWMLAALGILVLFLPWLPALIDQLAAGKPWPAHRFPLTPAMFVDTFALMTVGLPVLEAGDPRRWTIQSVGTSQVALAGFVAAVGLIVAGLRANAGARERTALLLSAVVGPVAFAYAVSLGVNLYAPRYLILIMPAVALLIGASVSALLATGAPWPKRVGAILLAAVVVPNVMVLMSFYRQSALDVFDWRRVSHTLADAARPDDAIVFLPGFARIPVNYYFRGPQPRLALTPNGPDVIGPGGAPMPAVVAFLSQHPRVWILTALPVPPSVDALVEALGRTSYTVRRREAINMTRLLLLERTGPP